VDAVRAAMMLRAGADCQGIAAALSHALILSEMMDFPWRCA
jgi:hypothetical protein